jgi:flagellar hook-basal body complex protein FliE
MTPILPVTMSVPALGGGMAAPLGASGLGAGGSTFQSVLSEAVQQVEHYQSNASASNGRFVSCEGEELHQVALATQQADLAFNLFMQVRNKVISAYQEVMRMQV